MTPSLFVRLMQGAFSRYLEAEDARDRQAALEEMAVLIRANYRGDVTEGFDPKVAQAGERDG